MCRLEILIAAIALLSTTGCGPQVSPEELGTLEYRIPAVPGSETLYPLDQLKEPVPVD